MLIMQKGKNVRKELIVLMIALTKGGKTTLAKAICHAACRNKMDFLSNCRTEVTVDWTYDSDTTDITLKDILLNYQSVFGTDCKERISCEKFSEILDSKEGKYLRDTFGFEQQANLSSEELEKYVLDKISNYIKSCDDKKLKDIIKNRLSNRFLRRIKISLPPADEFTNFFNEKNITFVLRDTRGFFDFDADEASKISYRTIQELGLDGINAVLLLGVTEPPADNVAWYKNAYKSAFESVPVFIMTRLDSVFNLYEMKYGEGYENINAENVRDFLQIAKKGNEIGFKKFPNSHIQSYKLLEMFDIGKIVGGEFQYNYKVYNNEDLQYVYPIFTTLDDENPDYSSEDYHLYELIVFENLKDMINKVVEHDSFIEIIYNQIKTDFVDTIKTDNIVDMYPDYNKYNREAVCSSILNGDILGPRDGIVTIQHGRINYLGTITGGVSSRIWIRNHIYSYTYSEILKNPDGSAMDLNMPKEYRDNLVRMTLFNIVEKNTDYQAYFRGYYFMNRFLIRRAILNLRDNKIPGDALTNVSKEIADILFKE